ncbi:TPA: hypothetical protein QDC37_000108 [Burkholderia aenigmatica]|nr:hypothetical protein [Burkholderia aenigmatica]HDR9724448.1 hypothetical protein [Burkholderia aenigmatica]
MQNISAFMFPLPVRATRIVGRRPPPPDDSRNGHSIDPVVHGIDRWIPPERPRDVLLQFAAVFHGHGLLPVSHDDNRKSGSIAGA